MLLFEQVQEDSFSHVLWPPKHPAEGEPIVLRDYQVDVINKFLELVLDSSVNIV